MSYILKNSRKKETGNPVSRYPAGILGNSITGMKALRGSFLIKTSHFLIKMTY